MPVVERIFPRRNPAETAAPVKRTRRAVWIALALVAVVSLLTYAGLAYFHQVNKPIAVQATATPTPSATISPTATPAPVYAKLDGRPVAAGKDNLHPLAVMIENHPDARPQAGLGSANLVYEAIAEGGITRFMAVFDDAAGTAVKVGPIRSARTYYLHFAEELHAIYAHAGGNIDALDEISAGAPIFNEDGLALGSPLFTRDYSRNVASEHTLYSTTDKLWNYAIQTRQWPTAGDYSAWTFQDDVALAQRPSSQSVVVNVSSSEYNVTWQYDRANNDYLRVMAGAPHIDVNTGKQITTKNIVLQTVDRRAILTRINEQGYVYTLTGSGVAVVIQDGISIKGTWKNDGTRTRYFDASGNEIAMVRGTTWVHLVHSDSVINY